MFLSDNNNSLRLLTRVCLMRFLLQHRTPSSIKALALPSSIAHAGDTLSIIPLSALGLHLHDWEIRLCLQYCLGLRMVEKGTRFPVSRAVADPFGDHQVGCGGNGDRIHQHISLRDASYSAAQFFALTPRVEVPSLIPGSRSHLADIHLPDWNRGQPATLDFMVISTMQQLTIAGASIT